MARSLPALAEVRRRQLELPLAADELLSDQAGALRQRPVVGQPADQVADVLCGLRGRSQHLHAALEVDLIAPDPACEVRSGGGAADVSEERDVVDVRALVCAAAKPIGQLERR